MPEGNRCSELVSENVKDFTKSADLPEVVSESGRTGGKCWMKVLDERFYAQIL